MTRILAGNCVLRLGSKSPLQKFEFGPYQNYANKKFWGFNLKVVKTNYQKLPNIYFPPNFPAILYKLQTWREIFLFSFR